MKISIEDSRAIYELASDPQNKLTNSQIGAKFGITESSVRHHIRKWERELKTISRNKAKVSTAIVNFQINILEEAFLMMRVVKSSIQSAQHQGISPEKIAPLYSNWIKILEMLSNIQIIKRIEKLEERRYDKKY